MNNIELRPNVYCLTGGMGCGKSTVVKELEQKHPDIHFLDCDQISKNLFFDPEVVSSLQQILESNILNEEGKIDTKKISTIIFSNPTKKQAMEEFIHPLVWQKIAEKIQNGNSDSIFIIEAAIIFETGEDKKFNHIIVVTCDEDEQINRIKNRNISWTEEEIKKRLQTQLPNKYKESKGWAVINTNCSLEELSAKVEKLYSHIKSGREEKISL